MVECERCDDSVEEQYVEPRADNRIICRACIFEQEQLDEVQKEIYNDFLRETHNFSNEAHIP